MVGFAHSRKGVALKSGEYVNRANFCSDKIRWHLYKCAAGIMLMFDNPNIQIDELVNETWLKHSRYYDRIQAQGTRQTMYRYLENQTRTDCEFNEFDCPVHCELHDDFEELFAQVSSKIGDTTTRFMLDLHIRHGMSYQQIGDYFDMTRQGVEARIKKAVRQEVVV